MSGPTGDVPSVGPARLVRRRTRAPVFTFRVDPGVPPVRSMRLDEAAVASVGGRRHVHDFPGIAYFEGTGGGAGPLRRIEPGDGFLVRPGEPVEVTDADQLVAARGWGLFFTPAALTGAGRGVHPNHRLGWQAHPLLWPFAAYDDPVSTQFRVPAEDRSTWTRTLRAIESEMHDRQDGYREAALAHLVVLLVATTRLLPISGTVRRSRSEGQPDLVERALAVIDARFADRLTLADVAGTLHVSPGHLTDTVREHTGRTVVEWIAERRLDEARRLLAGTELPVYEVARRVGYPDPGYFARVFRQVHGVPPRAWRAPPRGWV